MSKNHNLFSDQDEVAVPQKALAELKIRPGTAKAKLSPAQKRFNQLMTSIDAMRSELDAVQLVLDVQRPAYVAEHVRTAAEQTVLFRQMLDCLDQRLQAGKGLTASQKRQAKAILLGIYDQLAEQLDADGLAALAPLLARHRSAAEQAELADEESFAMGEPNAIFADMFGQDLADAEGIETEEDLFAALARQMAKEQAQEELKRAAKAAKNGGKNKQPSARAKAAEQKELDAHGALRTVYRQLASALHPDRELDGAERSRKTALMSEVNAAYGRRDLSALLRMQLQVAQVDASHLSAMADDKIRAMCRLLEEQVEALKYDQQDMAFVLEHEIGLPSYMTWEKGAVELAFQQGIETMKDEIYTMREHHLQVQDELGFKVWLKSQTQLMRQAEQDFGRAEEAEFAMLFGGAPGPKRRRRR